MAGFLNKNRDTLQPGLVEALQMSANPFVRQLFKTANEESKKRTDKLTTGAQFKVTGAAPTEDSSSN